MGLAAMLPGMVRAHELLGQQIAAMQAQLAGLQNGGGRKPGPQTEQARAKIAEARRGYWAKMTPEERSAEMKRRGGIAKKRAEGKPTHPRDPRHPKHAEYVEKLRVAGAARWARERAGKTAA